MPPPSFISQGRMGARKLALILMINSHFDRTPQYVHETESINKDYRTNSMNIRTLKLWFTNCNFQADQPSLDISADYYDEVTSPSPVTQPSQDNFDQSHLLAGAHRYLGTRQVRICVSYKSSQNSRQLYTLVLHTSIKGNRMV